MRFLANENFALAAVAALRGAGHDVAWIHADNPGASDDNVLSRASGEDRVLLTFDKDFGSLVFHRGMASSRGVILFRIPVIAPDELARFVVATIDSRNDWENHFSVVEPRRVRMRPLPAGDRS